MSLFNDLFRINAANASFQEAQKQAQASLDQSVQSHALDALSYAQANGVRAQHSAHNALAYRLALKPGENWPLGLQIIERFGEPDIFVFFLRNGIGGVLQEPRSMFPSDAMVAKIRLLMEGRDV